MPPVIGYHPNSWASGTASMRSASCRPSTSVYPSLPRGESTVDSDGCGSLLGLRGTVYGRDLHCWAGHGHHRSLAPHTRAPRVRGVRPRTSAFRGPGHTAQERPHAPSPGNVLTPSRHPSGALMVKIRGRTEYVAHLVCAAWIGDRPERHDPPARQRRADRQPSVQPAVWLVQRQRQGRCAQRPEPLGASDQMWDGHLLTGANLKPRPIGRRCRACSWTYDRLARLPAGRRTPEARQTIMDQCYAQIMRTYTQPHDRLTA